jgi:hypothetical protein
MDFSAAWTAFAIDDYVSVSDGRPQPSVVRGNAWFAWRSHNFVGQLTAKQGEAPHRTMTLELVPRDGATVSYTVHELGGHTFEASTFEVFSNG